MPWTKATIIKSLRQRHRAGKSLSYTRLAKDAQSLLSAAAYHFGSYPRAVAQAGIDYAQVTRRPRWTKQRIIALIKHARRGGTDLHWSAAISRGDELTKAAFASLQKRLFGSWARALHAAGLDADDVAVYRTWDRNTVIFELKARSADGEALSSGQVQSEDPGLHSASIRYFGNFESAIRAAGLDPSKTRLRRSWNKPMIARELKRLARPRNTISASAARDRNPALYGAAIRLFGSFTAARRAASLDGAIKRGPKPKPKSKSKTRRK